MHALGARSGYRSITMSPLLVCSSTCESRQRVRRRPKRRSVPAANATALHVTAAPPQCTYRHGVASPTTAPGGAALSEAGPATRLRATGPRRDSRTRQLRRPPGGIDAVQVSAGCAAAGFAHSAVCQLRRSDSACARAALRCEASICYRLRQRRALWHAGDAAPRLRAFAARPRLHCTHARTPGRQPRLLCRTCPSCCRRYWVFSKVEL